MLGSEKHVICPHCGAETRASMVLSLCPQCRQSLESAPSAEPERDWASPSEDEAPAEARRMVSCPKCHRYCWAASENCPICGADLRRRWISHIGCLSIVCGILGVPLLALVSHWHPALRTWLSPSQMQTVAAATPFLWCMAGGLIVIGILIRVGRSSVNAFPPPADPGWRAFAEEVGAQSFSGGEPPDWRIEVDHKAWTVVLDTYCFSRTWVGGTERTKEGTRCRASFLVQRPVALWAAGGGWRARKLVALGSQARQALGEWTGPVDRVATGNKAFDRAYSVWCSDEAAATALLSEPAIREVLLTYGFATELRVEPLELCQWRAHGEGTLDPTPPPKPQRGNPETMAVVFQTPTLVVEADGLRRLSELMQAALAKLCELGVASEEPPRVDLDGNPRRLPRPPPLEQPTPAVEPGRGSDTDEGPAPPPTIELPAPPGLSPAEGVPTTAQPAREPDGTHEQPDQAGFVEQPSYTGERGTGVIVRFADGYCLHIEDSVVGWRDEGEWGGKSVQVAEGRPADYHHVLATDLVRAVPRQSREQ